MGSVKCLVTRILFSLMNSAGTFLLLTNLPTPITTFSPTEPIYTCSWLKVMP